MGKKKILIIGPIGDFGGREIEVGFIARTLGEEYEVLVCSTGYISSWSQVFDFLQARQVTSFRIYLYTRFFWIRLCTIFSYLKNRRQHEPAFYAKNTINKKYFNAEGKIEKFIEALVSSTDVILICAQLSSSYLKKIVHYSAVHDTSVFFRTTGGISSLPGQGDDWVQKVYMFIHHSYGNASKLNYFNGYRYTIIDQCANSEDSLLEIPLVNRKVKVFLTIATLAQDKNIDVVIKAFKAAKEPGDKLKIVGQGPELQKLKNLAKDDVDITFVGFIPNKSLVNVFALCDCVIISHYEPETGPITGVEAMAAGRLIISAKTGAMPERLPTNPFWFDNTVEQLSNQIIKVKALERNQVLYLSKDMRYRYNNKYRKEIIQKEYIELMNSFFSEEQIKIEQCG